MDADTPAKTSLVANAEPTKKQDYEQDYEALWKSFLKKMILSYFGYNIGRKHKSEKCIGQRDVREVSIPTSNGLSRNTIPLIK